MIDTKIKGQSIGAFNPDRKAFKKYESSNPEKVGGISKNEKEPTKLSSQVLEEKMR